MKIRVERVLFEDPMKTELLNEVYGNYEDVMRVFAAKIESLEKAGYECEERGDWRHVLCVKRIGERVIEVDGLEVVIPVLDKLLISLTD